jgi:cephalosporin hydroxylase
MIRTIIKAAFVMILSVSFVEAADYGTLKKIKDKELKILEIGIADGQSLLIWSDYFKNSIIVGIDIHKIDVEEKNLNKKNIRVHQGSQSDKKFINEIINQYGNFDIIIDDGLHTKYAAKQMVDVAFKYLNDGGYYIIEDLLPCDIITHENIIEVWSEPRPCGCTYDDNRLLILKK